MFKNAIILLILLITAGCASHHGAAKITSSPSGAQVMDAETGEILGVTPLLLNWTETRGTRQQILVKLNKEGYYQKTEGFWLDMNSKSLKEANNHPNLVQISMRKIGE